MSWKSLLENTEQHRVSGHYQVIKFTPNLIAQETFNIGIVFHDNEDNRHVRMLKNAKAFECLYGKEGATQVQNMLNYAKDIAVKLGDTVIASPHLSYSTPLFTQGLTIDQILSSLYGQYINLICDHMETQSTQRQSINTDSLRKKLFKDLRKANPEGFKDILREDPFIIGGDSKVEINMPIWKHGDIFKNNFFGTLVSADFIPEAYLGYNLDTLGAMNLQTACEISGGKSRAGFFIYCPTPDNSDISEENYTNIIKHINKTSNNVKYMADRTNIPLKFVQSDDLKKLYEDILNFTYA